MEQPANADQGSNCSALLGEIRQFLGGVATPAPWLGEATRQLDVLLLDHRGLEYKAAQSALTLMGRYMTHGALVAKMSKLAREELVHFEQVTRILKQRGVHLRPLKAARYAAGLHALVRKGDPARLLDSLLVGAIIEARSCERFGALAAVVEGPLADFYRGLLESEGRHYRGYLALATGYLGQQQVDERLPALVAAENALILEPDGQFRFLSGVPALAG